MALMLRGIVELVHRDAPKCPSSNGGYFVLASSRAQWHEMLGSSGSMLG